MKRREFLLAGAALLLPLGAAAQQKVPRIGVLLVGGREPFWTLYQEGLRALGYIEGQNITTVLRSSEDQASRLPELAAELVRLEVDIIVASETPAVAAAKRATNNIPIVMAASGDPVGTGLIASLARPGGNVTGMSAATAEVAGKTLELIRELKPATRRVAVLGMTGNPLTKPFVEQIEFAGRALAIEIKPILVAREAQYDAAFAEMMHDRVDAFIFQPSLPHRRAIDLALQHRLPAVSVNATFVEAGGLMSYAGSLPERYRGAAAYIDKILKGAKPAELPVAQPTKFDIAINMKTAKALGLAVPATLLTRAQEVFE
jgi:putative ABC transport system substrate-binding protein